MYPENLQWKALPIHMTSTASLCHEGGPTLSLNPCNSLSKSCFFIFWIANSQCTCDSPSPPRYLPDLQQHSTNYKKRLKEIITVANPSPTQPARQLFTQSGGTRTREWYSILLTSTALSVLLFDQIHYQLPNWILISALCGKKVGPHSFSSVRFKL